METVFHSGEPAGVYWPMQKPPGVFMSVSESKVQSQQWQTVVHVCVLPLFLAT